MIDFNHEFYELNKKKMAVFTELGNIQIFFGQVVDTDDPMQSYRCRVAIPGKTDQIEKEKLPWYYAFNGVGNLPNENDEVPVFIFDGNFATGLYGSTMVNGPTQTEFTYKSYVELLKKGEALLTFNSQNGIDIKNGNNGINVNGNSVTLNAKDNGISITNDSIKLGNGEMEAALMGDKTIDYLKELLVYIEKLIVTFYGGFQQIMMAAAPNPYTAPIAANLTAFCASQQQIQIMTKMLDSKANTLQSKKTFHS